jgi:uncharacterized 2Fe-2S/4Fe-4S cluster protein (DUF4445 family)
VQQKLRLPYIYSQQDEHGNGTKAIMDESVKVVFHPLNKVVSVPQRSSVLDAIRKADIQFESICGGKGECKKCRVIHTRGKCTAGSPESIRGLSVDEIRQHFCLACQTYLLGDCEFFIPVESRIDTPKILLGICGEEAPIAPLVKKYPISFGYTALELSNGHRSIHLEGYTGKRPHMTADQYRRLISASDPCTVTISDSAGYPEIIAIEPGDTTGRNYGLAIDLGTTTIVGMMFNLAGMNFCSQASTLNRQITYGEELVTRLAFAREPSGLEKMRLAAVESINIVIGQLAGSNGIERTEIHEMCLAGNTVMQYLVTGRDPRGLELADAAVDKKPLIKKARDLDLQIHPEAYVYCLPNVSRYVGGDAVGDVIVSGMHRSEELSLLIDLGTNGEIIMGNAGWLASVSCASGPAFEGAGIKNGMRAMRGAIEHVTIDPENGVAAWTTIGNERPRGVCGSGIIDAAAAMEGAGILDFTGKLVDGKPGVVHGETGLEYVLVPEEESATGRNIVFTSQDMMYLMDSKAAACGAIGVLMKKYRIRLEDVRHVFLAGAFGAFTDLDSITRFGIIPRFLNADYHPIGNGSLTGAAAALLSARKRNEAETIAEKMVYIDLLVDVDFMEEYTAALYIPGKKEYFPD